MRLFEPLLAAVDWLAVAATLERWRTRTTRLRHTAVLPAIVAIAQILLEGAR
jgi:hypothetical protein